ncbi:MAG: hypothetical protein ACRBFS_08675 [Aureispira sp.]
MKFCLSIGMLLVTTMLLITSCGEPAIEADKMEDYVKPVAAFMSTSGVQLFSYFGTEAYKKEKVTLEAQICTSGSFGKNPALFTCKFAVDGVDFKNIVMVSEEDKKKVSETLKKVEVESKGEKESITVIVEAILIKEGSNKSPFGGEINLKFDEGKVLQIKE